MGADNNRLSRLRAQKSADSDGLSKTRGAKAPIAPVLNTPLRINEYGRIFFSLKTQEEK